MFLLQVLKLVDCYRSETNYTVWSAITSFLSKLHFLISHTDLVEKFNTYGINLYKQIAENIEWNSFDNENHLDSLLRSLVLSQLVRFQCNTTIAEAKKK